MDKAELIATVEKKMEIAKKSMIENGAIPVLVLGVRPNREAVVIEGFSMETEGRIAEMLEWFLGIVIEMEKTGNWEKSPTPL